MLIIVVFQFTDADGGVASEFVQKLQMLNADNSKTELSIEKFLIKSEEAYFGKVRRDKLDSAASIRSSNRDSIWGTPAPSLYSRPDCMFFFSSDDDGLYQACLSVAPNMQAYPGAGYDGALPNGPDVVVMSGLQIFMSREIGGWPLYTIVIGLGQVCLSWILNSQCY
jgi:alpha-1,3-glucan synthase